MWALSALGREGPVPQNDKWRARERARVVPSHRGAAFGPSHEHRLQEGRMTRQTVLSQIVPPNLSLADRHIWYRPESSK